MTNRPNPNNDADADLAGEMDPQEAVDESHEERIDNARKA